MSESISFGVPMLSVPIEGQYEQELNARSLEQLGYGSWARQLTRKSLKEFLDRLVHYEESLKNYERRDNAILFDCVDELLERIRTKQKRPSRLKSEAMGKWGKG